MEDIETTPPLEEELPSIDLAYEFVTSSHDLAEKRLNAMEERAERTLTLIATISLAFPALFNTISPFSVWFALAGISAALAIGFGLVGRQFGHLKIVGPSILYEDWLQLSQQDFKKYMIQYAGKALDVNRGMIQRKHRAISWMLGAFFFEIVFLIIWVLVG